MRFDRNLDELRRHGGVCATVAQTSPQGGRPAMEYWLSEPQALLIATLSRTEQAADVRTALIGVYMSWRRGKLPPSRRALPPVEPTVWRGSAVSRDNRIDHWLGLRHQCDRRLAALGWTDDGDDDGP